MKMRRKPLNQVVENIPVKSIGRKVKIVRVMKGYSQEYLAMRLGVSQNAFSKLERGKIRIRPDRFKKIAEILEMSPYMIAKVNADQFDFIWKSPGIYG